MKNILIACEESQEVCKAFRERGFNAFSCDIQPCSGGHPEWHIKGDAIYTIQSDTFITQTNQMYHIEKWDLIIAHPPCTRLCASGQRWLYTQDIDYNLQKVCEQAKAINFFLFFTIIKCDHIAIENPVGIMSTQYRKPDQIYNPFDFQGETECKKTCLWLKGLPKLKPTQNLPIEKRTHNIWKAQFNGKQYRWNDKEVAKLRSKTPHGVAVAMAEQWGNYLLKGCNNEI